MDASSKPATKYRASCDGCYLAKLKCSKERPTCPRCKNLGLVCKYSPSQRTGKPRGSKAHDTSASQVLEWQPGLPSQEGPIMALDRNTQSSETTIMQSNNDSSATHQGTTTPMWPASTAMTYDFDDGLLAPWREYLPTPDTEHSMYQISDDFVSFTATPPSPSRDPDLIALNESLTPNATRLHSCSCSQSLTQALHEMEVHSKRPSGPTLETILSGSKDVATRGETLLQCACFEDSTLIMLFVALVTKYISFYSATKTDIVTTLSPNSPTSSAEMSSTASRVTVGKYTMDVEDEERLCTEIMMMELQKLNSLLMKFRGRLSSWPVGYEGHTYETVLNFLSTRLREATDRLQRRKQRLKEEA